MAESLTRLRLRRPLVAFDLETTGLDLQQDRIVEISMVKIFPDGTREVRTRRLNPGMPIPPSASAVHGILDEDVRDCPRFAQVANSLHALLADCDLTGFNVAKFDLPFLANEFQRCGLAFPAPGTHVLDSYRLYTLREPRDLGSALRYYCDREPMNAHSAEADAIAAADVLLGQLARYEDLPDTVDALEEIIHPRDPSWADATGKLAWRGEDLIVQFGQKKGRSLRDLLSTEPDFLRWILRKDFPTDVKILVEAVLNGQHPRPSA
jgi:DNA polymerase-3 subunit epsilon